MPKPSEKRVRIGMSLAPDVAEILAEHGRCSLPALKDPAGNICVTCDRPLTDRHHVPNIDGVMMPTRTEIIEEAVREWRQRRAARNLIRREVEETLRDLPGKQRGETGDPDMDMPLNTISPEAKAQREVVKSAKRGRKAKLQESVSEALPPKSMGQAMRELQTLVARGDLQSVIPAVPSYCPRHRPKYCEPDCKYRVSA